MKWEIELRYEEGCGPMKLSGIGFREAIYGGYDTKEEALEAFCRGQVALNQMMKENEEKEEEKKREEFLDKIEEATKRKMLGVNEEAPGREESSEGNCTDGLKRCASPGFKVEVKSPIEERLDYIEQRIDLADDYLATIGSPEWGLRKQVRRLEERIDSIDGYLTDSYLPPNYKSLEERIKALEIGKSSKEETTAIGKYGPNWYCESCYGFVEREDKFCSHCGRRIIEEKEE